MNKQLFQPFEENTEKRLLSIGVIFTLIGSSLAYIFNGRFDGVLDLHFTDRVQFFQPFLDNLINIACLTVFLYFAAIYTNGKTRFVDVLTAAIVARIPYYALLFFNVNNFISNSTKAVMNSALVGGTGSLEPSDVGTILIFAFFAIAFLISYIVLLYNGFKVASNAKGAFPVFLFFIAVLIAEVFSKYLIHLINY